jgi:hypothetical protein
MPLGVHVRVHLYTRRISLNSRFTKLILAVKKKPRLRKAEPCILDELLLLRRLRAEKYAVEKG